MIIKLNQLWITKIIQYLNVKRTGKNLWIHQALFLIMPHKPQWCNKLQNHQHRQLSQTQVRTTQSHCRSSCLHCSVLQSTLDCYDWQTITRSITGMKGLVSKETVVPWWWEKVNQTTHNMTIWWSFWWNTKSCKKLEQRFIFQLSILNPDGINESFSFNYVQSNLY